MKFFKNVVVFIVATGAIIYSGYFIYQKTINPCEKPLKYGIGRFDNQFGISKEEFRLQILEAGATWERALGRDIFNYDPDADLKINLIYDERQLATIQKQKTEFGLSAVEDVFKKLDADFNIFKNQYDQKVTIYEQNLALYKKGRLSNAEIQKLNTQATELNNMTRELNILLKERNAKATEYNKIAQDYNKKYSGGLEFNQAEFVSDSSGERINVYQFSNKRDLIIALTHELGHALGMNHVENPKSIMYYLTGVNAGASSTPTAEDLTELKRVCKK